MVESTLHPAATNRTFDLAEVAKVRRGERVAVEQIRDSTQELFDETLALVREELGPDVRPHGQQQGAQPRYVPEHRDLRSIFLLADALGSYDVLNDLVNTYSPGRVLSEEFSDKARRAALKDSELKQLLTYQQEIHSALKSANSYLRDVVIEDFDREELHQLHELILLARKRAKELQDILGIHYLHEVERVVEELYAFRDQIHSVERSIEGIFLVNSNVLFVPTNRLIDCVNTVFAAVGNAWLAKHIDGVLLLAARNLIIEVAAFHSYYGKLQIYDLFRKTGGSLTVQSVSVRIRGEIRRLFNACKKDNKLVLTRIMETAEREFDLSVESLQEEALRNAVEQVKLFIPKEETPKEEIKRSMLKRLLDWFVK